MKIVPCSLGPSITVSDAKSLGPNFADAFSLPERTSTISLGTNRSLSDVSIDFLFSYDIFPSYVMKHETEWKRLSRSMQQGDIVIQRAMIPPIGFGFCMEFAVRISKIIEEESKIGFAYETLDGHAESGVSEFYFETKEEGLYFTIHTYSEPGHWTSKSVRFFTLPYQAWCTRRALNHVKRRFLEEN